MPATCSRPVPLTGLVVVEPSPRLAPAARAPRLARRDRRRAARRRVRADYAGLSAIARHLPGVAEAEVLVRGRPAGVARGDAPGPCRRRTAPLRGPRQRRARRALGARYLRQTLGNALRIARRATRPADGPGRRASGGDCRRRSVARPEHPRPAPGSRPGGAHRLRHGAAPAAVARRRPRPGRRARPDGGQRLSPGSPARSAYDLARRRSQPARLGVHPLRRADVRVPRRRPRALALADGGRARSGPARGVGLGRHGGVRPGGAHGLPAHRLRRRRPGVHGRPAVLPRHHAGGAVGQLGRRRRDVRARDGTARRTLAGDDRHRRRRAAGTHGVPSHLVPRLAGHARPRSAGRRGRQRHRRRHPPRRRHSPGPGRGPRWCSHSRRRRTPAASEARTGRRRGARDLARLAALEARGWEVPPSWRAADPDLDPAGLRAILEGPEYRAWRLGRRAAASSPDEPLTTQP